MKQERRLRMIVAVSGFLIALMGLIVLLAGAPWYEGLLPILSGFCTLIGAYSH